MLVPKKNPPILVLVDNCGKTYRLVLWSLHPKGSFERKESKLSPRLFFLPFMFLWRPPLLPSSSELLILSKSWKERYFFSGGEERSRMAEDEKEGTKFCAFLFFLLLRWGIKREEGTFLHSCVPQKPFIAPCHLPLSSCCAQEDSTMGQAEHFLCWIRSGAYGLRHGISDMGTFILHTLIYCSKFFSDAEQKMQ